MKAMLMLAGVAAVLAAAPAAGSQDGPVAFETTVRVAVDAAGRPAAVEALAPLPPAVREFVETRARALDFEPPVVDGRPRGGITYVVLGVCAVPAGDEMLMAAEYRRNGPGHAGGAPYADLPRYPAEAVKRGWGVDMTLDFTVRPDGKAVLDGVEFNGDRPRRGRAMFERMARQWVAGMQLLPEEVDGEPISTRVRVPLEFSVAPAGSRAAREMLEGVRRKWERTPECLAAAEGPGGQVLAAQSPFAVRDVADPG